MESFGPESRYCRPLSLKLASILFWPLQFALRDRPPKKFRGHSTLTFFTRAAPGRSTKAVPRTVFVSPTDNFISQVLSAMMNPSASRKRRRGNSCNDRSVLFLTLTWYDQRHQLSFDSMTFVVRLRISRSGRWLEAPPFGCTRETGCCSNSISLFKADRASFASSFPSCEAQVQPLVSFPSILRHALAQRVAQAQPQRCLRMSRIGSFAVPLHRLDLILRHASASGI